MSEMIDVCPECGTYHIYPRRPSIGHSADDDHAYRCQSCSATFDEPDERERGGQGGIPGHSLASDLADMDPEEVGL